MTRTFSTLLAVALAYWQRRRLARFAQRTAWNTFNAQQRSDRLVRALPRGQFDLAGDRGHARTGASASFGQLY